MDTEKHVELTGLHSQTLGASDALQAQAAETLELTQRLEQLTKDTPAWHAATRTRVEARATLEQAKELVRVLEELGRLRAR